MVKSIVALLPTIVECIYREECKVDVVSVGMMMMMVFGRGVVAAVVYCNPSESMVNTSSPLHFHSLSSRITTSTL